MKKETIKKLVVAVVFLAVAAVSFFYVSKIAASTEFHKKTIESLNNKKITVMELAAASTATSAAISLLPGDTATPIATKLADFSGYFLIVLCAILIEKYLLTITGYLSFTVLIPVACLFFAINTYVNNAYIKYMAKKILVFGIAIFLVVPISIKTSNIIENTYDKSIQETLDSAKNTINEIEKNTENNNNEAQEGFLSGIIDKVETGLTDVSEKVKNALNNFIEALAVLIVTSCLIPILVLFFFVWLIKLFMGINVNVPLSLKKNQEE